jgi:hypothetical protein
MFTVQPFGLTTQRWLSAEPVSDDSYKTVLCSALGFLPMTLNYAFAL